jgi:CHAD domain-containing protein
MPDSKTSDASDKASDKAEAAFGRNAAEVIHARLEQIGALSQGLLDPSDVKPAAEMFLATRRMRVALEVFRPAFPKAQYRNGREETLLLARAVADRFHLDVAINTISSIAEEMSEEDVIGVAGLLKDLEKKRVEANRELGRVVHGRRMHAYRVRMEDLAVAAAGPDFEVPDNRRPMRKAPPSALRVVQRRLDRLRSFTPEALEPGGAFEQRGMGIAAEKLRYSLELTGEALGTQAQTARRAARGLQLTLAEMASCDTILPLVRERISVLEGEDAEVLVERARGARDLDPVLVQAAPNRAAYRGLELVAVHLQARRIMLFGGFRRLWKEQSRQGVWVALENSLKK